MPLQVAGVGYVDDPAIQRMFYLKEIGTWDTRTALLELSGAHVATNATNSPHVMHAMGESQPTSWRLTNPPTGSRAAVEHALLVVREDSLPSMKHV